MGIPFCPKCGSHDIHEVKPTANEQMMLDLLVNATSGDESYRAICTQCGITFQTNYLTLCLHCGEVLDSDPMPQPKSWVDYMKESLHEYPGMSKPESDFTIDVSKKEKSYNQMEHATGSSGHKPMSRETFDKLWGGEWPDGR